MKHSELLAFFIVTGYFLIWAIATRKWLMVFLSWLYLMVGVALLFIITEWSGIGAFFFAAFWSVYPVGRMMRHNKDLL